VHARQSHTPPSFLIICPCSATLPIHRAHPGAPSAVQVQVEIMGAQKCRIVGKYQPILIMISPIIFTRSRTTAFACWSPPPNRHSIAAPTPRAAGYATTITGHRRQARQESRAHTPAGTEGGRAGPQPAAGPPAPGSVCQLVECVSVERVSVKRRGGGLSVGCATRAIAA
jgi:hypothetical protein